MIRERTKKILVVDNEEETIFYLSNILKRAHFDVSSTTSGRKTLALAKEILPDLIILDIVMPDMSGGEVAAALSDDVDTASIPILFATGLITKEEENNLLRGERYYLIAKPIDLRELFDTIGTILFK